MGSGNVMVIEDQYHFRKGLVKMIEDSEYNWNVVSEASNGLDALKLLEAHKPDLILTDIRMPVMDGIEFVTNVKEKYPDTLVIILSGYRDFEYAQAAIKLGVIDYLVKPCMEEDIKKVLHKASLRFKSLQINKPSVSEQIDRKDKDVKENIPTEEKQIKLIAKATAYIHLHYADDCRMTEVAAHVRLNSSYFSVLFKKVTNESFTTYLTRIRMEKAVHLLCHSDMKVFEIAAATGFEGSNYFTNVFRQFYSMSPKEYRNTFRETTNSQ